MSFIRLATISRLLAAATLLGLAACSSASSAQDAANAPTAPQAAATTATANPAPMAANTTAGAATTNPSPEKPAATMATSTGKDPFAEYFGDWPAGTSPQEIGKRVAENFLPRQFRYETPPQSTGRGAATAPVIYPEVVCWYGALTFANVTKDKDLEQKLIDKFDRFLTPEGAAHISRAKTVDTHVFGAVPLEIYLLTKDKKYLDLGLSFADDQLANVFRAGADSAEPTIVQGQGAEARYWADDLYMLPIVQVQAFRASGNNTYLDRTAQLFADYLDKLQQPSGLFFHGNTAHYYWCRGDGWVAAGMTELLRNLPKTNPHYDRIMSGYKLMMAALLKYQGDDGIWKQLIDHPEAWSESSGSGMFTFAMITGVKNGWLDAKTYGPAARKAWLGLVKLIDADGNIANMCQGTNQWSPTGRGMNPDPVAYYLTRPVDTGAQLMTADELHGNAPVLWAATALLR